MKKILMTPRLAVLLCALMFAAGRLPAQTDETSYVWPKDPAVLANLKKWQGYKFGIIIHEGLYSQLGRVESWELCPEDWVTRRGFDDYTAFTNFYRGTRTNFNPVNFDPAKWAKAFKADGVKYVVYTTKHHDGFCLWDTKYTDFKVTDKATPFSKNPKADMVKTAFDAFRAEGLAVGAYFSKPDWTSTNFWWSINPPKDRNPTYDIKKYPARWKAFIDYTQNQLNELTSDYGKIDILWLDGCWVRPLSTVTTNVAEYCKYPYDMDIDMKKIAETARAKQPGMLVVDRWVPGDYESYLHPENKASEKPLSVPWESCMTMGGAWGWVPNQRYKSTHDLVQMLVKIVAKGGNLLLGIGPDGKGEFDAVVYQRLDEIGQWLKKNGEAIYDTTTVSPFLEGKMAYTAKGDHTIYAIYMPDRNETQLPAEITVKTSLKGNLTVTAPAFGQTLKSAPVDGGIKVTIPDSLRASDQPAFVIAVKN